MKLFWFDSETTGTDPQNHQMLTFATVVTDLKLNILNELYTQIKLLPNITPDPKALAINKLDPYSLFWAMESVDEPKFCDQINDFYQANKGSVNHWIAYNSKFDTSFLKQSFVRSGKNFVAKSDKVFDPLVMCRVAVKENKILTDEVYSQKDRKYYRPATLVAVAKVLETSHEGDAHNALVDTKCLIKTIPKAYSRLYPNKDFSLFFSEKNYVKEF